MITTLQALASARALKNTAVWAGAIGTGSAVGVTLAVAYLAGGMAQSAAQHSRVTRLAAAAEQGFSETALIDTALKMDPGVLAVARRHDPFTTAGAAHRDRQAALIAARLERTAKGRSAQDLLLRTSFGGAFNPAAQPFRLGGALDASRDLECLTQAIYYEARGEGPAGQAAVAQVVLNRVRHPAFPKSVCAVVFQGAYGRGACQFSFACDGSMRRGREAGAWRRAQRVAEKALSGVVMTAVGNATHFHTINVAPGWGPRLMRVGQVGLHIFYRFGGRAGRPGAFSAEPELSTDAPELANEPIYASFSPSSVAIPADAAGPEQVYRLAGAMLETKPEIVPTMAAANGMGGPSGQPVEPASAPMATAPAEAKPAAPAPVKAPAEAAVKPAKPTSSSAS